MTRMSYAIRAIVITVALLLAVWADYLGYPRVLAAVGYSTLVCGAVNACYSAVAGRDSISLTAYATASAIAELVAFALAVCVVLVE